MVRIETNGSGVQVVLVGCPFCDAEGTKYLRYYNTYWSVDQDMDNGRRAFRISYCPFCGNFLPSIEQWEVKIPKRNQTND